MKRFTTSETEAPAVSLPRRLAPVRGRFFLATVLLALSRLTPLAFAGFDEGVAAYNAGNFTLAHEEFLKAADQGDASAQYNLGVMYGKGQGVPRDYEAAVRWYRRAAEQGHAGGQNNLGVMYDKGRGVPRNYIEAYMWFSLAAAQAYDAAANNLDLLEKGMTPGQIAAAQELARNWRPR